MAAWHHWINHSWSDNRDKGARDTRKSLYLFSKSLALHIDKKDILLYNILLFVLNSYHSIIIYFLTFSWGLILTWVNILDVSASERNTFGEVWLGLLSDRRACYLAGALLGSLSGSIYFDDATGVRLGYLLRRLLGYVGSNLRLKGFFLGWLVSFSSGKLG